MTNPKNNNTMKKAIKTTLQHLMLIAIGSVAISTASCSQDAHSKATCVYYVTADTIIHTVDDEAQYDTLLMHSLASLNIAFYSFTESAEADNGWTIYAIDNCDTKATETFQTALSKTYTLSTIEEELYNQNKDHFTSLGITKAQDIDLHPFTVSMTLWNYTYETILKSEELEIMN